MYTNEELECLRCVGHKYQMTPINYYLLKPCDALTYGKLIRTSPPFAGFVIIRLNMWQKRDPFAGWAKLVNGRRCGLARITVERLYSATARTRDFVMKTVVTLVALALCAAAPAHAQIVGKDGQVQFGAKTQRWEANSRTMYLDGEVELYQDGARLRCDHARLIQSADSGETVQVEVTGNIFYVAKDAAGAETVLKGDLGVYTRANDTLVVTGRQVIMTQGQNVMVGTRLTSQLEKGVTVMDSGADGRVRGVLAPRDNGAPGTSGTR